MPRSPAPSKTDRQRALAQLRDWIQEDGTLRGYGQFVCFPELEGGCKVTLEGVFTANQVEALAWWMRHGKA